jgi:AcrR family transcriptional regulator
MNHTKKYGRLDRGLGAQQNLRTMTATTGRDKAGGRLDREAYFNAAFKILATQGFLELTVDNLCAELGATKGSFYHHFAGMPEFTEALVAAWESTVTERFRGAAALPLLEGLAHSLAMLDQWPVRAEGALRAWGWANPVVAIAVRRQEAAWEGLMHQWLAQVIPDPERCRLLAHMMVAVLAGMSRLGEPPELEVVRAVCFEFLRSNVGIELPPGVDQSAAS